MVTVPVVSSFVFDGHEYQPGDLITCAPVVAAAFARQGKVSLTRTQNKVMVADNPEVEAPRPRRRYRRRDMTAEQP